MVSGWFYLHLPTTIGIAALGAAVLNVVEHAEVHLAAEARWLLVAAMSIALISIGLLMRTIQISAEHERIHRMGRRVTLISAIIVFLLGFSSLSTIPLLVVLILLMLGPGFYGFKVWIEMLGAEEIALT